MRMRCWVLATMCLASSVWAQPLTTQFSYQGTLNVSGSPANGTLDVRFRLFDAPSGGTAVGPTLCSDNLAVVSGNLAATLDFGAVFAGQRRWLQIEVRADTGLGCADDTGWTTLEPRSEITATPNALFSLTAQSATLATNASALNGQGSGFYQNASNLTGGTLPNARLSGTYTSRVNLTNATNTLAGNGAGITALSASNISTGVLSAVHMPADWAAGGDLTGFYPSPLIAPGVVGASQLSSDVNAALARVPIASISPVQSVQIGVVPGPRLLAAEGNVLCSWNTNGLPSGQGELTVYDTSNPALLPLLGSITRPLVVPADPSLPGRMAIQGSTVYVVGPDRVALYRFSVANPAAPTLTWQAGLSGGSIVTVKGLALTATHMVVSMTRSPDGTSFLKLYSLATLAEVGSVTLPAAAGPVGVVGSLACVTAGSSFICIDISNPAAHVILGQTSLGSSAISARDMVVRGTHAYLTAEVPVDFTTGQVFDVSNPAAPAFVGSFPSAGPYSSFWKPLALAGSTLLVPQDGGWISVCSLASPASPALVERISGAPADIYTIVTTADRAFAASFGVPPAITGFRLQQAAAVTGLLQSAGGFVGNGSQLSSLNAANISTGTLSTSRLPTTTARTDTTQTYTARPAFDGGVSGSSSPFTVDSTTVVTSLNADLLDGQHGAYYRDAANLTGTVPAANLPANLALLDTAQTFAGPVNFTNVIGSNKAAPLAPFHLLTQDLALTTAALENDEIIVEAEDAAIGLYSANVGSWGSALTLKEVAGGVLTDTWGIARRTTNGGASLRFTYGPNDDYAANPARLILSADGTASFAGPLVIPSTARTHAIPGVTFRPGNSIVSYDVSTFGLVLGEGSDLSSDGAWAAVDVPDGATITGIIADVLDTDTASNMTVRLHRITATGGASVVSVASAGSSGFQSVTASTSESVDLSTAAYAVGVFWNETNDAVTRFRLHRVRVTYTVTSPLP